jgi:DNA-binding XRE family transcriptional regulator
MLKGFDLELDVPEEGVNPIRYARAVEQITTAQLARNLKISRSFVVRIEQGCYRNPGTELARYASHTLDIPVSEIISRYKQFQKHVRQNTLDNCPELRPISGPVAAEDQNKKFSSDAVTTRIFTHDVFSAWREEYWPQSIDFCTSMCVHPASVKKFEAGLMLNMPEQLVEVLQETGLLGNIEYKQRWYYV